MSESQEQEKRRYSGSERLQIVTDYMAQNDGEADPGKFVEAAASPQHPAHDWFDWEESVAAHKWRLQQARQFFRITVKVEVEQDTSLVDGTTTVRVEQRPALVAQRAVENALISTATEQGTTELRAGILDGPLGLRPFLRRYQTVMQDAEVTAIERAVRLIEKNDRKANES